MREEALFEVEPHALGRLSKCGDKMLRSYLYEAANVLLTRVAKWSALLGFAMLQKEQPRFTH